MLKKFLYWLLTGLYKVEVQGFDNYSKAGNRVLIVANHTSFLDPLLLGVFLPDNVTFAIDTYIANSRWIQPFLGFSSVFKMDPTNPLSSKALIKFLKQNNKAVIFPEGRITVTGSLMKIYDGSGMIADKSGAVVLPIRIDGAQYTPFSRMRGRIRLRWFPKITINILAPTTLSPPKGVVARERRKYAGRMLAELMTEMIFATSNFRRTIIAAILDARRIHGGSHLVLDDINRAPLTYNGLINHSICLGGLVRTYTANDEFVGVMLPNVAQTVLVMLGLQFYGRVPTMLNYTMGPKSLESACITAKLNVVITSSRFIETAKLEKSVDALSQHATVVYLEDLGDQISLKDKVCAAVKSFTTDYWFDDAEQGYHKPAVILFTSGSEGTPKGVVLSHYNLLGNLQQLASKIDFSSRDIILNALPLFHSFGLTAGTILPLVSGMKTFLYPSPLHYRIVPEVAYEINATILFGTNTFLAGYAKHAHPYDFYSVRYVFSGAEKLQQETRNSWSSKFGIRIFEGYGATETSPLLSANTPMEHREGTVGRFIPGVQHQLQEVPGVKYGARLHVTGPNIMLGYLLVQKPGEIQPPSSVFGDGWYDTGDIVHIDEEGYISICGRAKRFAKIAGEMVSLAVAEGVASKAWPESLSAVVAVPDADRGERLILVTEELKASRRALIENAEGISEINLPKKILAGQCVPLLGSGKIDYFGVKALVEKEFGL